MADSRNVDVYLALDGVLSAANASRAIASRRFDAFPHPIACPRPWCSSLGWRLAEAGEARPAEALFHNRFFPQEEGGTSVRTVYAQVRLISARTAADKGDCSAARDILDGLTREQKDLAFTTGGLADALQPPMMARQVAAIDGTCGRQDAARDAMARARKGT